MTDCFEISIDVTRRILHLKVWGFWTITQAECYRENMIEAMEALGRSPWSVLADVRKFPIQMRQVQAIHSDLMKLSLMNGMVCSANIVGGRLTKVQIERMSSEVWPEKERFAYFHTRSEAETWLEGERHVPDKGCFQQLAQTI